MAGLPDEHSSVETLTIGGTRRRQRRGALWAGLPVAVVLALLAALLASDHPGSAGEPAPGLPLADAPTSTRVVVLAWPVRVVDLSNGNVTEIQDIRGEAPGWEYDLLYPGTVPVLAIRSPYRLWQDANIRLRLYRLGASHSAQPIGVARRAAAGTGNTLLYLQSQDVRGRQLLRPIGLDGRPAGRPVRLPEDATVERGTVRGVLVERDRPGASEWEIWNPADGESTARFDHVVAATANTVAARTGDEALELHDLGTDAVSRLVLPPGRGDLTDARFSPDGEHLAVRYVGGPQGEIHDVWVLDVAEREWEPFPGSPVRYSGQLDVYWSGPHLVMLGRDDPVTVSAWQPGSEHAYGRDLAAPDTS